MEHQNEIKTIEAEINILLSIPYKTVRFLDNPDIQKSVILMDDLLKVVGEKRAILKNLKKS